MPTLPQSPFGMPGLAVISFQLSPPSTDLNMPPPGPPEFSDHGVRYAFQNAAYKMFGSFGSRIKSEMPTFSLRYKTFFQLLPPSVVLNTPRCSFGPNACPNTPIQMMSGFVG